ncbi:ATP-binding cassette domain-containing protein [Aliiroseovarius sp. PrR006]|uniref:ATP-binding cassette domain-containing protein n=1 Tax=Aliiroseovarius sp. PrR006 TaxID=2706883 RepID=UPI00351A587D
MYPMIKIEGVRHAYQTPTGPLPVLDGLEMSLEEGGFVAVVGPSGCGKSTLRGPDGLSPGICIWITGFYYRRRDLVGWVYQKPRNNFWRKPLAYKFN